MERSLLGVLFLSEWFVLSTCFPRYYHFVDQSLTWTSAQGYCRHKYTDLATMENPIERNLLLDTVSSAGQKSDVWIGLSNQVHWTWSDGFSESGAEFSNWDTAEPNFFHSGQVCVVVGGAGEWYDDFCRLAYPFVCNNGSQLDPEFVLVNLSMSWSNADRYCRENFTSPVTVRNDTENQMVRSLVPNGGYVWIGLSRSLKFHWSDGSQIFFENWDDVPNHITSTVICGVTSVERSGRWKFHSCGSKLPFVCFSYLTPVKQRVVKLRVKVEDSVDLNDPDVKAELLEKLQDRLKENGVTGVTLKWRKQPDGEVFHKEEQRAKR